MNIQTGKIYYAPILFDIDDTEIYIKSKKEFKKVKKAFKDLGFNDFEKSTKREVMYSKDKEAIIIRFRYRPVLVLRNIVGTEKSKIVPLYTEREKYKSDEYC